MFHWFHRCLASVKHRYIHWSVTSVAVVASIKPVSSATFVASFTLLSPVTTVVSDTTSVTFDTSTLLYATSVQLVSPVYP